MAEETCRENVLVYCHANGCIKNGPDGVFFEGSTLKKFRVKRKTKLSRLLDGMYQTFGLNKQRSKFEIFGKYPAVGQESVVTYLLLPVVDDSSLETMFEVPSNHPSINNVELYLEVKSTSDDQIDPAACSSPLANTGSPFKRQRTQQVMAEGCLNKVSKPCLQDTSWWLDDDHELRVGSCFRDRDDLRKAVDWCSIRGRRKCLARETGKDMFTFECVQTWKCKWSLCAAKREEHGGCFEITHYTGPHTCSPEVFEAEFVENEIERVVRVHPACSIAELSKWWIEKTGYEIETQKIKDGKMKAVARQSKDEDYGFRVIPKLMSALHSSNGLLVDWKYDIFPNPKFASFCGVFWAFPQCIEGFQHCRPVILVDTRELDGEYKLKLMIASGVDAANNLLPLAFAVTKQVSTDSWRWFLTNIREKVTQRKGICLISCHYPDILDVVNEPDSLWKEPWAYHRFCLDSISYQYARLFPDYHLSRLVKQAGFTSQKEKFDSYMKEIEEKNPEAWRWLDKIPPHEWALAHDGGRRYGIMQIDTEALFAVCRDFPHWRLAMSGFVVLVFDELRSLFDKSFSSSRGSLNRGDAYTEPVIKKVEEFITSSSTYIITPSERNAFQVSEPSKNKEWIVQLNESTCTCGEFQSCKFPCLHALALCDKLEINPLQYVDDCYTLESYYKTYAAKFNHVPEFSAWPEVSGVPTFFPPVIGPPLPKVSGKSLRETNPYW